MQEKLADRVKTILIAAFGGPVGDNDKLLPAVDYAQEHVLALLGDGEPVAEIFEFRCDYPQIRFLRPDDVKVGDKLYLHAAPRREPGE